MYKVFIADDEMWVIIGLKKLIEKSKLPFSVIGEANNGVTALEEVESKKPDVLITDIRMPGYNGLELINRVNEKRIDVKAVFISGYTEFEYARSAVRLGAFDYLLKPVEQEALNDVLERIQIQLHKGQGISEVEEAYLESPVMLNQVIHEIQEGYMGNITLCGLAEKYGISTGYLSSLLKAELGLSFIEYMTSKRIQKAKELLTDEKLSIDTIAGMVGYNDYFYFTKVFKKTTGISPGKYRKNLI